MFKLSLPQDLKISFNTHFHQKNMPMKSLHFLYLTRFWSSDRLKKGSWGQTHILPSLIWGQRIPTSSWLKC